MAENTKAIVPHYKWDNGLTLRDWRYVVRVANIDVSNLSDPATGSEHRKIDDSRSASNPKSWHGQAGLLHEPKR